MSRVDLAWTDPNNPSKFDYKLRIYRSESPIDSSTLPATPLVDELEPKTEEYSDLTAPPNKLLYYRVEAYTIDNTALMVKDIEATTKSNLYLLHFYDISGLATIYTSEKRDSLNRVVRKPAYQPTRTNSIINTVESDASGNVIIANASEHLVVKLDSNGNNVFTASVPVSNNSTSTWYRVVVDGNGDIYVPNTNGAITKLDGTTGNQLWNSAVVNTEPVYPMGHIYSCDVGTDGFIYACCSNGRVYRIRKETGEISWQIDDSQATLYQIVVDDDSNTYVIGSNNLLRKYDVYGELQWSVSIANGNTTFMIRSISGNLLLATEYRTVNYHAGINVSELSISDGSMIKSYVKDDLISFTSARYANRTTIVGDMSQDMDGNVYFTLGFRAGYTSSTNSGTRWRYGWGVYMLDHTLTSVSTLEGRTNYSSRTSNSNGVQPPKLTLEPGYYRTSKNLLLKP